MQPCFKRLDPTPFRIMCDQDTAGVPLNRPAGQKEVEETKGPQCLAVEAYIEQCKFVGMEISMPSECGEFFFFFKQKYRRKNNITHYT